LKPDDNPTEIDRSRHVLRRSLLAWPLALFAITSASRANDALRSPSSVSGATGAGAGARLSSAQQPRWLEGMRAGEWRRIPRTAPSTLGDAPFVGTYGQPANHLAYSGAALKRDGSWLLQFGGGHADYSGNDVIAISLEADAPAWRVLRGPTVPPDRSSWSLNAHPELKGIWWDAHHLPDGRPASRHSGSALQYIDASERLMSFYNTSAFGTSSTTTGHVDGFRWADRDWDRAGTWPALPHGFATSYPWTVKDSATEDVYLGIGSAIYRWRHGDGRFTPVFSGAGWAIDHGVAGIDSVRNRLIVIGIWNDSARVAAHVVRLDTGQRSFVTLTGPQAHMMATSAQVGGSGFDWCPDLGRFLFFPDDGFTYTLDPATFAVERMQVSGTPPPAASRYSADNGSGVHGRFRYVPHLRGCVYLASWQKDLWFLRTAN
jgi:hypothetical protein